CHAPWLGGAGAAGGAASPRCCLIASTSFFRIATSPASAVCTALTSLTPAFHSVATLAPSAPAAASAAGSPCRATYQVASTNRMSEDQDSPVKKFLSASNMTFLSCGGVVGVG